MQMSLRMEKKSVLVWKNEIKFPGNKFQTRESENDGKTKVIFNLFGWKSSGSLRDAPEKHKNNVWPFLSWSKNQFQIINFQREV